MHSRLTLEKHFGPHSPLGHALACVLLSAFVFIGLIPTGFMPDIGSRSGHYITICTGLETRDIQDPNTPATHHTNAGVCTFFIPSFTSITPDIPILTPPLLVILALIAKPKSFVLQAHGHQPSAPRAPPAA